MSTVQVTVTLAAGSRRPDRSPAYVVPHAWTEGGIAVEGGGTGADLLLVALGACLLNDTYREAPTGVPVDGVRVAVEGVFATDSWSATTVSYDLEVDSPADAATVAGLVDHVASVAEIPRVLQGDVAVARRAS